MRTWIMAYYRNKAPLSQAELHSHNEFEIYMFHQGDCKYIIRDRIHPLHPGDMLLMNGLTPHRADPLPGTTYDRSVIQFSPEWIWPVINALNVPELFAPFYKLNNCLFRRTGDIHFERIEGHMQRIASLVAEAEQSGNAREISTGRHLAQAQVKTAVIELLYEIYAVSESQLSQLSKQDSEKERHIEKIVSWIDRRFVEKLSLDDVAGGLNISKYYLTRIFKEGTGFTVMEYLMNRRVTHAKYLLEMERDKSILDVALESGFESPAHFSRFFREKIGVTPSDYRKEQRGVSSKK